MIERFNGNVVPFADDATLTNRTVFGGTTQSDAIDDNLNADFKKGWEIVGLNDNPTREDFNAMGYTLGALISYLYEMGISEWNASQNYRINSRVIGSDGKIYKALTGTTGTPNVGNNPTTDAVNWELEFKNFVTLTGNQTIAGVKTFSDNPQSTATQSTVAYALTRKDYVDGLNAQNVKLTDNQTIAGVKTFSSSPIVPTQTAGDNSTKVATTAFVKAKSEADSIGVGQTWQDVTSSRASDTTYTNTTGKPIMVIVGQNGGTNVSLKAFVNSVLISYAGGGSHPGRLIGVLIVPSLATYSFTFSNATMLSWFELR